MVLFVVAVILRRLATIGNPMISKNQLKLLRALGQKKQRRLHNLFLVQGEKNTLELLGSSMTVRTIFATDEFISQHKNRLNNFDVVSCSEAELSKASTLTSNNAAIAIVETPQIKQLSEQNIILALDNISDPGNLGTIIRLADWYGIKDIVCNSQCADPYNPKTIAATMGSFTRVNVLQTELADFIKQAELPVYGAFLNGNNVHKQVFEDKLILVMGNESHGISDKLAELVTNPITIPQFGQAESLNVAMATGIILDNIKRGG